MTVRVSIRGGEGLRLEHLVLDVTGALTDRGAPIACALAGLGCCPSQAPQAKTNR